MTNLADATESLTPSQKRELLKSLLQKRAKTAPAPAVHPVSHMQNDQWVHEQLVPGSGANILPISARIHSQIDVAILHKAFQALVDRHAVLRTTFESREGRTVQLVHPRAAAAFEHRDARQWSSEQLAQRLHEDLNRPFDLKTGPVHRVTLYSEADDRHILLFVVHHIVADFWSLEILIDELGRFYHAIKTNTPPSLAPLQCEFVDYVKWEANFLASPEASGHLEYAKEQLAQPLPILDLPIDHPRPAIKTNRGGTRLLKVDDRLAEKLRALAKSENTTLYATLLSTFQTLLFRYTGQTDLIVGAPTAARNRPDFRDLVGCLVGGIFIRSTFSAQLTFRQLLRQTRGKLLESLDHQDYPTSLVVEMLGIPVDPSRAPVAEVMFGWDRIRPSVQAGGAGSSDWLKFDNLIEETFSLRHPGAVFDLLMIGIDSDSSLAVIVQYNSDLFDDSTIVRLEGHFTRLLESIVINADRPLLDLPMLSDSEQKTLFVEWGGPNVPTTPACFHELFERAVVESPDGIALEFGGEGMTFAELNAPNRLAHWLAGQGVGLEHRVGVCFEPSFELIVAIYGIMKAGAAYVPLDPHSPAERLQLVLRDARPAAIVTLSRHSQMFAGLNARIVCLDAELESLGEQPAANPEIAVHLDNAAYAIYTSGSTGTPKGVVVTHRSVANLHSAMRAGIYSGVRGPLRGALYAPIVFDVSVEQVLLLAFGYTLVIPSSELRADAEGMVRFIRDNRLDVLDVTPSHLRMMLDAGLDLSDPASPALVVAGAEVLDERLFQQLAAVDRIQAFNAYGPTECTVDATYNRITGQQPASAIGRPIANTQAYVLDELMNPVPVGVAGELYVGGAQLARGYFNQPQLTAEKFVPDPFSGRAGARLYRTGDRVRRLADGRIDFLSRVDDQIKIRGFRIEPREIETALALHPQIKACVVTVRPSGGHDVRLVAYVVTRSGAALAPGSLRAFLNGKLPFYMVPSYFIVVDKIPMTTNGKVDLKALPSVSGTRPDLAADYIAPRNDIELKLAEIWAEVLDVDRVGVHDNFFELGGHSIFLTRIVSRLRSEWSVELPIRVMFEAPTIGELGLRVEVALRSGNLAEAPTLYAVERGEYMPMSFAQQRLWLIDQLVPESAAYNVPAGIRVCGRLNVDVLRKCLAEIFRRHESLRTTFSVVNDEPVQVIQRYTVPDLVFVDLEHLAPDERKTEVQRRMQREANEPFDLSRDAMLRMQVVRLSFDDFVILMSMHHIASDAWSVGVLIQETAALYNAFARNQPAPLPRLPIQYADYAVWQRKYLTADVVEKQLEYWTSVLAGPLPQLELPTDRPRPAIQTDHGAHVVRSLPTTLVDAAAGLSRDRGATLFMTLLAAYNVFLARMTGQDDFAVGTPVSGRDRLETEGLVGFFVNTLVLRGDVSGNPTFAETLARTREACLEAFAHQQLPFEQLVEALNPKRDLSRTPLFQTMFALQNTPMRRVELEGGLSFEPMQMADRPVNFDLTLDIGEAEDGWVAVWDYNTDLFDRETVERFAAAFECLLTGIVERPAARLSELPVLTEAEQRTLAEWNATDFASVSPLCFHEMLESQAARIPEAIAVVCGSDQLTFQQLNARANQLARALRERGIGVESTVGLCLHPSVEAIVALFAIMKAGGAYVPLSPRSPPRRLELIVQDCAAKLVITAAEHAELFAASNVQVLCLDSNPEELNIQSAENLGTSIDLDNAAYAIYTSGSTGASKGVVVAHRSVANLSAALRVEMYAEPARPLRAAMFAPIVFDASVEQILQIAHGNTLYIPRADLRGDPDAMLKFVTENRLDVLDVTPTHLRMFLEAGLDLRDNSAPSVVFAGAEALDQRLFEQLAAVDRIRAFNVYGPTECTVDATYSRITGRPPSSAIGGPIANTQAHVLDEHLNRVPIGVVGELYIGGDQLRGYLNQPRLTAEKFIPDPFSGRAVPRLYRSGDRVRWLPDGRLDFLGRLDEEIKVHGFRINPGEIETALLEHPQVSAALVVAQKFHEESRLVAYVVVAGHMQDDQQNLNLHLQSRLPSYMIPGAIAIVDALPINTNGKVDRNRLPAFEFSAGDAERTVVPPTTQLEIEIARVWSEVLYVDNPGIHDDFFAMGGNSLSAARLVVALRRKYDVDLPLHRLFQTPTIGSLAEFIEQKTNSTEDSSQGILVPLQPHGDERPFFCVHGGTGTPLSFGQLAHRLGENQPVYAFRAMGLAGDERPLSVISAMASEYIRCMQRVQPHGPYRLGGWSMGGLVALEMARQLEAMNESVELLVPFDTWLVFDEPTLAMFDAMSKLGALDGSDADADRETILSVIESSDSALNAIVEMGGMNELLAEGGAESLAAGGQSTSSIGDYLKAAEPAVIQEISRYLRVLAANSRAMAEYRAEPCICPVALFIAGNEPQSTGEHVATAWRRIASGGLHTFVVPGTHHTMLSEPNVAELSEVLRGIFASPLGIACAVEQIAAQPL